MLARPRNPLFLKLVLLALSILSLIVSVIFSMSVFFVVCFYSVLFLSSWPILVIIPVGLELLPNPFSIRLFLAGFSIFTGVCYSLGKTVPFPVSDGNDGSDWFTATRLHGLIKPLLISLVLYKFEGLDKLKGY
jgi:hypothetical protein